MILFELFRQLDKQSILMSVSGLDDPIAIIIIILVVLLLLKGLV